MVSSIKRFINYWWLPVLSFILAVLVVLAVLALVLSVQPQQDNTHTVTLYTHGITLYCRTVKPDQRIAYDCLGGNVTRYGAVVMGADDTYALADGSASDNAGGQK